MFNLLEGTQGVPFKPSCREARWCKSQISTRQRQKQASLGEFKASLTSQVPGPAGLHKERLWLTVGKNDIRDQLDSYSEIKSTGCFV